MPTENPATRAQRLALRNERIKTRFAEISAQHPQWRLEAYLATLQKEFLPLSRTTIYRIVTGHYG